jgi:hypothetical protein
MKKNIFHRELLTPLGLATPGTSGQGCGYGPAKQG